MSETTTIHFGTTGMHCHSCAMLIDMTLGDLEGVEEAKTDYADGETVVSYDPQKVQPDDMVAAIRSVGYDAAVK